MSNPADAEVTPVERPPRVGLWFQVLTMGYAGVIVLSEAIDGRFALLGAGYITLTLLSAVLALGSGLLDRFRPSIFVGWLTVFAVVMAVLVAAAPTGGTSDWNIPLLFATAPSDIGAATTYIPLVQTFANPPASVFETLSGVAFWGLIVAWFLSLRSGRRAAQKKS